MLLSWLMFILAAVMPFVRLISKKNSPLFPFLCVLFACAGAVAGVLSGMSLLTVGTGASAVLLTALLVPEGSGET